MISRRKYNDRFAVIRVIEEVISMTIIETSFLRMRAQKGPFSLFLSSDLFRFLPVPRCPSLQATMGHRVATRRNDSRRGITSHSCCESPFCEIANAFLSFADRRRNDCVVVRWSGITPANGPLRSHRLKLRVRRSYLKGRPRWHADALPPRSSYRVNIDKNTMWYIIVCCRRRGVRNAASNITEIVARV